MTTIKTRDSPGNLPLYPELWSQICSYLSKPSLSRLRLVSSQLSQISLPCLFKSILVEADDDSVDRFVKIAKSPKLRGLVRELTVDTWIPFFRYNCNEEYPFPTAFMESITYIRAFTNVTALHLRFNERCGLLGRSGLDLEETWGFRHRVLDTICHCIVGLWTKQKQLKIDEMMTTVGNDTYHLFGDVCLTYPDEEPGIENDHVMQLKELTISNLADYRDENLYASDAWKKLVSLPSLVDLKLLIATEENEASPETAVYYTEKYEFFDKLSEGWLTPHLASNLRVLSLFHTNYWGWIPRPDFQNMNFPKLQILALGNYVFSHEWEIDWFASLGKDNTSGGLEELYLDDCPILFKARQLSPLNKASSSPGYPIPEIVVNSWDPQTYQFPLRWHHILSHWGNSMKSLRLFCTGHGDWHTYHDSFSDDEDESDICEGNHKKINHRIGSNIHRVFAGHVRQRDGGEEIYRGSINTNFFYGQGIKTDQRHQLQYIEYDIGVGPSPWREGRRARPYEGPFGPDEETLNKDHAAYMAFTAITANRAGNDRR